MKNKVYKTSAKRRASNYAYRARKMRDPKWRRRYLKKMRDWRRRNHTRLIKTNRTRQRHMSIEIRLQRKGLPVILAALVRSHPGLCDICGKKGGGRWRSLNIDHCHKTKRFRGMLCENCNRALGYFQDDVELLRKAIRYLNRKMLPGEALAPLSARVTDGTK